MTAGFNKNDWVTARPRDPTLFDRIAELSLVLAIRWPRRGQVSEKLRALTHTQEFKELVTLVEKLPAEVRPASDALTLIVWLHQVAHATGRLVL